MLCPECSEKDMRIVDATGEGYACWQCPTCHYVLEYNREDEGLVWDGKDDGEFLVVSNE